MDIMELIASRRAVHSPGRRDPGTRLRALLDSGSLTDLTPVGDHGVRIASGSVLGRPAVAFASDPARMGGAMGSAACEVILEAYALARRSECPIIGLWHSGGARLREGVRSMHGVGKVFAAMTHASGVIPQISVVLGPAAGAAAYGPALTDLVILAPEGRIFVTGPDVVRSVTGEQVDALRLGGPELHARQSGVAHLVAKGEAEAYAMAREAASLLGDHGRLEPTKVDDRSFSDLLPESAKRAYDVRPLVHRLLDDSGLELHPRWAPNIVTVLGRLGGRSIGVIANNPLRLGGCLDSASAEKSARFVRMCDALGLPLVVVVDVPGYLPGLSQESSGVVRRGAKLLHAFAESVVPRVTLLTRKAYGGAYVAMNSRALGATRVFAWPGAEVAVMGPVAAVRILHRRVLAEAPETERPMLEDALAADHERAVGGLDPALELAVIDEVIDPGQTRSRIAEAIYAAGDVRGSHGNIPL